MNSNATISDQPCEHLPWDSAFFGVQTARVSGDTLTADRVAAIDAWCGARNIAWLYFLARGDDARTARCAEDGKFRLVDIRVTLERKLAQDRPVEGVGAYREQDLADLKRIARAAYRDSRFYYDGRIPAEKCDELFELWTAQTCQREPASVLVARDNNRAIGYVTCSAEGPGKPANIALIGVDQAYRGKGIGQKLVQAALAWAATQNASLMTVVTQGRNIPAQRLYQRCGFVTRSQQLYYHKWYE